MKHHPEQHDDEIYLGNTRSEDLLQSAWRSSRLGNITYKADGQPFKSFSLRPWFIKVAEVTSEIEKERLNNKPWSEERIKLFQSMIDRRSIFP